MTPSNLASLKKVLLFSELPENLLVEIAAKSRSRSLKKGEVLFREGDEGDALFIISSGELEIFRGHENDENRQVIVKLGVGEHFGEMSLLENKPRFATVRALQNCELLSLQRADFEKLLEENGQLALKLTADISARLRKVAGVQFAEQISITASDLRKSNIFISYSRRDKAFVQSLHKLVSAAGINVWVDWENIPLTADWWEEILEGIKKADAFVFIISPDSVNSRVCQREIVAAIEHNKRIIPILHREISKGAELPETIANANWVPMQSNEELHSNLNDMLTSVNTDIGWVRQHTRILNRAMEWKASGYSRDLLLSRANLEEAETWLAKSSSIPTPKPLPLHTEYIHTSRRESERRMRFSLGAGVIFSLFTVVALIVSAIGYRNANIARSEAEAARVIAVQNANTAATAQAIAEEELKRSEQLRLSLEANSILEDPSGNVETAALLSLVALRTGYISQADYSLVRSMEYLYTLQNFTGHTDALNAIAYSPDGKNLLTGSDDMTARLWDAETGVELAQFIGHTDQVKSAAFSPDGTYVLTGSDDGTARLWNAKTGEEIRQITGHTGQVTSVQFSPNGKYILTTSADGTARLWVTSSGNEFFSFVGHNGEVTSASFSKNGNYIITGGVDGTARLWDVSTGLEILVFTGHPRDVSSVAISPDGRFVLTGSDTIAKMFSTATGLLIRQFVGHTDRVRSVTFSPDGNYVLTGSSDLTARLWDTDTGVELRRFSGHTDQIRGVVFSPNGAQIATASRDTTARIWNVANESANTLQGHTGGVLTLEFSPNGQFIVTGSEDNTIRIWSAETKQELAVIKGHKNWVSSTAVSPDGKLLLSGSLDGTAIIWDFETQKELLRLTGHNIEITSVSFSPDGKTLLTCSADRTARLWDANTGKEIRQFTGHISSVEDAAFSPDGRLIATASNDNTVRIWDVDTGEELKILIGHTDEVKSVSFSPDGKYVASASDDRTVRVWKIDTGEEILQLKKHENQVKSVMYSPDGKYLLSGSDDTTAILWDATSGDIIRIFALHTAPVKAVTFSPNGNFILTGSIDQTVHIWDTEYTDTMKEACGQIFRSLVEEDRERYLISSTLSACP